MAKKTSSAPVQGKVRTDHPDLLAFACEERVVIAADGEGDASRPTFKMTAYNGKPMRVSRWGDPVVIDYDGLQLNAQVTIRRDHSPFQLVGHTDNVEVKGKNLLANGLLSFENEHAEEVRAAARNGFKWQASVGVIPSKVEYFPEGVTTSVNGMNVKGPIDVIRKGVLREISFVDMGASDGTKVSVSASAAENSMAKKTTGAEPDTKNTNSDPATNNEPPANADPDVNASATGTAVADPPPVTADETTAGIRAAAAKETGRITGIYEVAANHPEICQKAIEGGWSKDKTELEVLRTIRDDRPSGPGIKASSNDPIGPKVLEAAICAAGRLGDVEKRFDDQTLQAAHTRFKGRIGLQEVLLEAAYEGGYSGRGTVNSGNIREVLQAAFSTVDLPGILSDSANKFLLAGFMAVDQTWRKIAAVRAVNDFKAVTSYRLDGGFEYDKVGPDGELKHATTGETSYTNAAETYGKMFSLTRTHIINDDLGALVAIPQRIGRGGAMKLNKVFWTEFLNNATFFTSANGSYFEGASSALDLTSLGVALQMFRDQKDPDGNPLAIPPALLLVPTALEVTAANLMNSTEIRDQSASNKKSGTHNPFAGMFEPLTTPYLSDATIPGFSSSAWHLLANPMDLAAIEMAFLNGVEEPTVEAAEADFNILGIQMRGYHDFGVNKQEFRAGVKSKGVA